MITTKFGKINPFKYPQLSFANGLAGFPELTSWILLPKEPSSKLQYMQSIDDGTMSFVVMEFEDLPSAYVQSINKQFTTGLAIVCIPSNPEKITINLKAPILLNGSIGVQEILSNRGYHTKHKFKDKEVIL